MPLSDKIFVSNMSFGEQKSKSGLVLLGDNGKSTGIYPRWCQVWAVGKKQHDINVGEWILVEHGRWTRTVKFETDTGEIIEVRMVDNKGIMLTSPDRPLDLQRAE